MLTLEMYISYIQIESNVLYYHPLLLSQIIFDRTEQFKI